MSLVKVGKTPGTLKGLTLNNIATSPQKVKSAVEVTLLGHEALIETLQAKVRCRGYILYSEIISLLHAYEGLRAAALSDAAQPRILDQVERQNLELALSHLYAAGDATAQYKASLDEARMIRVDYPKALNSLAVAT